MKNEALGEMDKQINKNILCIYKYNKYKLIHINIINIYEIKKSKEGRNKGEGKRNLREEC